MSDPNAETARILASKRWGDTGFARVTALGKGGYIASAGHTISTGAGIREVVTVVDQTSDSDAWKALVEAMK